MPLSKRLAFARKASRLDFDAKGHPVNEILCLPSSLTLLGPQLPCIQRASTPALSTVKLPENFQKSSSVTIAENHKRDNDKLIFQKEGYLDETIRHNLQHQRETEDQELQ
jgi:hypothetical protein